MESPPPAYGQDPANAQWLSDRVTGGFATPTSLVPAGYDAYARLLHPAGDDATRWADVASALGTVVHPLVRWHEVVGAKDAFDDKGSSWPTRPDIGQVPSATLSRLLDVLLRHTATPHDCWFATWSGHGWVAGSPAIRVLGSSDHLAPGLGTNATAAGTATISGRNHLIGRGPLLSAAAQGQQVADDWFEPHAPNLIWPSDRSWVAATDIDADSTFIAGSASLIGELLATAGLECLPVEPSAPLNGYEHG